MPCSIASCARSSGSADFQVPGIPILGRPLKRSRLNTVRSAPNSSMISHSAGASERLEAGHNGARSAIELEQSSSRFQIASVPDRRSGESRLR